MDGKKVQQILNQEHKQKQKPKSAEGKHQTNNKKKERRLWKKNPFTMQKHAWIQITIIQLYLFWRNSHSFLEKISGFVQKRFRFVNPLKFFRLNWGSGCNLLIDARLTRGEISIFFWAKYIE